MIYILIGIILIVVFLFNSFSKFNSWNRQNEAKLNEVFFNLQQDPNNLELLYIKAVALMNLQNYPAAIKEYEQLINKQNELKDYLFESVELNIKFCRKPLPWSSSFVENKSGSYIHYVLLKYAGNNRSILR